jgi:hypothetical protein
MDRGAERAALISIRRVYDLLSSCSASPSSSYGPALPHTASLASREADVWNVLFWKKVGRREAAAKRSVDEESENDGGGVRSIARKYEIDNETTGQWRMGMFMIALSLVQ